MIACDPSSKCHVTVENNSSHVLIYAGEKLYPNSQILKINGGMGSYTYWKRTNRCTCHELDLTPEDTTLTLTKQTSDCNNWEKSDKKVNGICGEFKIKFKIADSDIK